METMGNTEKQTGVSNLPFVSQIQPPVKSWYIPVKRCLDLVFGLILGIFALPIIAAFAVAVKLDSKGNAFYSQERVGYMGKLIKVTKLRSMRNDAERDSGAKWAEKDDPRVTRVGSFMRKTRIDELPQIWSVIKGDMSFIGPRPERPELTEKFCHENPGFEQRLRIMPGLSGYAQVHGGYEITPGKKAILDRYYIAHFSLKMDLLIIFETIRVVLTGDGAR